MNHTASLGLRQSAASSKGLVLCLKQQPELQTLA
jgi:hypothetical protein